MSPHTVDMMPAASTDGLAPLQANDADTFVMACDLGRARSYLHHFPMLYFYGSDGRLRWERHRDSILIYQVRRQRTGVVRLNLYLPPMPFDAAALRHALERMRDFNRDEEGQIIWVTEEDALRVARAGLSIFFKEDEYIFDRAAVMALDGSGFRSLRQELSRAQKAGQLETRPYRAEDEPACLALVEEWKDRLVTAGMKTDEDRAMRACLAGAGCFSYPLLSGIVAEIDGVVRGFAFSGRLSNTMGCNYLCITDHRFRGLPHLLRYRLMQTYPELPYFNDSVDSGRKGLRELKQRFRPVEMQGLYGAKIVAQEASLAERDRLRKERDRLRKERDLYGAKIVAQEASLAERDRLRKERDRLRKDLTSVLDSRWWRVSSPIRTTISALRRLRRS